MAEGAAPIPPWKSWAASPRSMPCAQRPAEGQSHWMPWRPEPCAHWQTGLWIWYRRGARQPRVASIIMIATCRKREGDGRGAHGHQAGSTRGGCLQGKLRLCFRQLCDLAPMPEQLLVIFSTPKAAKAGSLLCPHLLFFIIAVPSSIAYSFHPAALSLTLVLCPSFYAALTSLAPVKAEELPGWQGIQIEDSEASDCPIPNGISSKQCQAFNLTSPQPRNPLTALPC